MAKLTPPERPGEPKAPAANDSPEPLASCYLKFRRGGDVEAFGRLVTEMSVPLLNFFYRKCWDRNLSEDLAQDTFHKLLRTTAGYEPTAPFKVYLFQVARNIWIDYTRSAHNREFGPKFGKEESCVSTLQETLTDSRNLPLIECLQNTEERYRLKSAIHGLSEKLRDVVELGVYQEMSYSDIGAVLGIPEGTVKSRMHNAILQLRQAVKGKRS